MRFYRCNLLFRAYNNHFFNIFRPVYLSAEFVINQRVWPKFQFKIPGDKGWLFIIYAMIYIICQTTNCADILTKNAFSPFIVQYLFLPRLNPAYIKSSKKEQNLSAMAMLSFLFAFLLVRRFDKVVRKSERSGKNISAKINKLFISMQH
jgi:hypothetical protein